MKKSEKKGVGYITLPTLNIYENTGGDIYISDGK